MNVLGPTLTHLFKNRIAYSRDKTAYKRKVNGLWEEVSFQEYRDFVEAICLALMDAAIERQDRIAILSNTRLEWALSDMGILSAGAITVPIYQSSVEEEIRYILQNSAAKAIFVEDRDQLKKVLAVKNKLPQLKQIIVFKPGEDVSNPDQQIFTFEQFCQQGLRYKEKHQPDFGALLEITQPEDIASIVYTSGTTGIPKGVVLTHRNFMSELSDIAKSFDQLGDSDTVLTFLPYAHILARIEHYCGLLYGWTAAFAEGIPQLVDNLAEIKPTFMFSVPRIYEKVYNKIIGQMESGSALKKAIFYWSLRIGKNVSRLRQEGFRLTPWLSLKYRIAKKLVFNKLHQKFGGRIRFFLSGGAPLSRDIAEFFHAADILILEGYGLTETTAAIFLNREMNYEFGTVGQPLKDVEIKFNEDGEILIKSGKVFTEYYKNPEATREAFTQGWLRTGDIGQLTEKGNLKITDRKKDIIVTSAGKNIAPQKIESQLKLDRHISQIMVYGDRKNYLSALVTLNDEEIQKFAKEQGIPTNGNLHQKPEVKNLIRSIIEKNNALLASFETVKKFTILKQDFSIEAGELTPSMKIRRKFCSQKYKDILEAMYD